MCRSRDLESNAIIGVEIYEFRQKLKNLEFLQNSSFRQSPGTIWIDFVSVEAVPSVFDEALRDQKKSFFKSPILCMFGPRDKKRRFLKGFIFLIFGLRDHWEIVGDAIGSRMYESASKLVSSGRSGKFVSIFMFPALPEAIYSYSGSAQC